MDAVGEIVERVGGVIRPVHDLAFDALESVALLARCEFHGKCLPAHCEVEPAFLVVVEVVVGFVGGLFSKERLVLQHAIQQRTRGIHADTAFAEKCLRQDAQCLRITLEAAVGFHQRVQRALSGVAEGRMTEVVAEAGAFDEVGVDEAVVSESFILLRQPGADAAADLRHLNAVSQSRSVEVILAGEEDLRLALQPAEGAAVDDAVAVDLKRVPVLARMLGTRVESLEVEGGVKAVRGHAWCAAMLAGHGRGARCGSTPAAKRKLHRRHALLGCGVALLPFSIHKGWSEGALLSRCDFIFRHALRPQAAAMLHSVFLSFKHDGSSDWPRLPAFKTAPYSAAPVYRPPRRLSRISPKSLQVPHSLRPD